MTNNLNFRRCINNFPLHIIYREQYFVIPESMQLLQNI